MNRITDEQHVKLHWSRSEATQLRRATMGLPREGEDGDRDGKEEQGWCKCHFHNRYSIITWCVALCCLSMQSTRIIPNGLFYASKRIPTVIMLILIFFFIWVLKALKTIHIITFSFIYVLKAVYIIHIIFADRAQRGSHWRRDLVSHEARICAVPRRRIALPARTRSQGGGRGALARGRLRSHLRSRSRRGSSYFLYGKMCQRTIPGGALWVL